MGDPRCLIETEQACEERRMMAGGHDQISVHIAGQRCNLFRWAADKNNRVTPPA